VARWSVRATVASGLCALALAVAGLRLVTISTTRQPTTTETVSVGTSRPGSVPADPAVSGTAGPGSAAGHPTAAPVPAVAGDGYIRNVTPGASCAPVGGRGFTTQSRLMRCSTTATDRRPRWRTP
jgi:hypothetical protein